MTIAEYIKYLQKLNQDWLLCGESDNSGVTSLGLPIPKEKLADNWDVECLTKYFNFPLPVGTPIYTICL